MTKPESPSLACQTLRTSVLVYRQPSVPGKNRALAPGPMRLSSLLKETVRSGTIASLVMMPFGIFFKLLDLRVGHYGPKLAALLFGQSSWGVLLAQHFVIGWISTLPLLLILVRFQRFSAPVAIGAVYGLVYYVVVNSLALPLFFGDPTPWQSGLNVIYPSLLVHVVFGLCIGLTSRRFVSSQSKRV